MYTPRIDGCQCDIRRNLRGRDGRQGDHELLRPEGPIVFAGEHLSYQGLWQEGAALSAHEALKLVEAMAAERAGARPG